MLCLEATRVVVDRRGRGRAQVDFDDEAGGRLVRHCTVTGGGSAGDSLVVNFFKTLHRYVKQSLVHISQ